jgi:hypothetical protein
MFRSRARNIIIPQSEHARLAAVVAAAWGNPDFDRPPVDYDVFLKAVLLHDRAFGFFDSHPIGATSDEVWVRLQRRGLVGDDGDALCDLLIQQHIRRLAGYLKGPMGKQFRSEIAKLITIGMTKSGLEADKLERADRVLALCDSLAFDFCFEEPTHSSCFVYPRNSAHGEIEMQYQIHPGGEIQISPWPLSLDSLRGFMLGYQADSYPTNLDPVFIPYHLMPGVW